jgi:tetratricopeptide (TPR) repeat protein
MTTSRLLTRLEADIAAATDPVAADCLRAERASYLARQGWFDEAREVLEQLRAKYGKAPRVEVSIWINLVDGLVSYFTDTGRQAVDKIMRASALSSAANIAPLSALCLGWLAHTDFAALRIEAMARNLKEAWLLLAPEQSAGVTRLALVMAEALHFADRLDLAMPWYALAKRHANMLGDDATISASMHNMTVMKVANRRQRALRAMSSNSQGGFELQSAKSTSNYDEQIGANSLTSQLATVRAQVLTLEGEFASALDIYTSIFEAAAAQGMQRFFSTMLSDRAWCQANLGHLEAALADCQMAEAKLIPETQIDDVATAHSRLAQTYTLLHMPEEAKRQSELAAAAWSEVDKLNARIVELLQSLPHERLNL